MHSLLAGKPEHPKGPCTDPECFRPFCRGYQLGYAEGYADGAAAAVEDE